MSHLEDQNPIVRVGGREYDRVTVTHIVAPKGVTELDEYVRSIYDARINLRIAVQFCRSILNDIYIHQAVPIPTNRGGTIHDELNSELAYFMLQSDDVWRVILEFI